MIYTFLLLQSDTQSCLDHVQPFPQMRVVVLVDHMLFVHW